jgi:hypothetical protein
VYAAPFFNISLSNRHASEGFEKVALLSEKAHISDQRKVSTQEILNLIGYICAESRGVALSALLPWPSVWGGVVQLFSNSWRDSSIGFQGE